MKKIQNSRRSKKFCRTTLPKSSLALRIIIQQPRISNRHTPRLETGVTHSKQTTAPCSNRHIQGVQRTKFALRGSLKSKIKESP
jgi:hypothetical protein